jgi:release factor glutamine methyltransferase
MGTAGEVIEAARKRLLRHVDDFSRRGDERAQARELLEHVTGGRLDDEDPVDERFYSRFNRLIERRTTGEPVPYIRGYEEFRGLRLSVKPGAFIPRQSTEFLAEQAIRRLRRRTDPIAADLATGVGAVAVAIAGEVPDATVFGTDISKPALRLARANARSHDARNVRFLAGSMFEPLPKRLRGSFDVIASHPPYVATTELHELPRELTAFEPMDSLTDASGDGLGLMRVLVGNAIDWLKPGGWLCVEMGSDLARTVRSMMTRAGYSEIRSTRGPIAESRVLVAKR